jgi:hypothetical protein
MDENKTGVWIRCMNNKEIRYNHDCHSSFDVGDIVEVENDDIYVKFKIEVVELTGVSNVLATYTIKPQLMIDRTTPFYSVTKFHDAEPIEMDVYANNEALIIVPFWYEKEQYRNQSIRSTEAVITITRKESLKTINEDLEIKTGTISADKIQVDTLTLPPLSERRVSALPHYQQKPITATSEAEKNWLGGLSAPGESRMIHDDHGLSPYAPTHIVWNGETSATLTFSSEKLDEIMSELTENEEEKDMNTEKLKDKIKKVIYVDKEMTVREPVLDSNGKPIERGGKPVTKAKFYRGMVKVVWNCGTETVAYTSRFDRFNREEGFKTCVLKYLFGNAGAHDAVDFWTNKYVKYPSSCIEVTENLCKLEKILEKDKKREEERKGLPHAKFFREIKDEMLFDSYDDESLKNINEFKKLAKKYFPELKGKEIYINDNKQDEKFVAIK